MPGHCSWPPKEVVTSPSQLGYVDMQVGMNGTRYLNTGIDFSKGSFKHSVERKKEEFGK